MDVYLPNRETASLENLLKNPVEATIYGDSPKYNEALLNWYLKQPNVMAQNTAMEYVPRYAGVSANGQFENPTSNEITKRPYVVPPLAPKELPYRRISATPFMADTAHVAYGGKQIPATVMAHELGHDLGWITDIYGKQPSDTFINGYYDEDKAPPVVKAFYDKTKDFAQRQGWEELANRWADANSSYIDGNPWGNMLGYGIQQIYENPGKDYGKPEDAKKYREVMDAVNKNMEKISEAVFNNKSVRLRGRTVPAETVKDWVRFNPGPYRYPIEMNGQLGNYVPEENPGGMWNDILNFVFPAKKEKDKKAAEAIATQFNLPALKDYLEWAMRRNSAPLAQQLLRDPKYIIDYPEQPEAMVGGD